MANASDLAQNVDFRVSSKKPAPPPTPPRRSKLPWLIGGGVVVGGLMWLMNRSGSSGSGSETDPGPGPDPEPEPGPGPQLEEPPPLDKDPMDFLAEEAFCIEVAKYKPKSYLNRVRPLGLTDAEWWGLIAYWKAYPLGPVQPKGTAYADAAIRILECVKQRLNAEPKPPPPPDPKVDEIQIPPAVVFGPNADNTTTAPTPAKFYPIVAGDNFTKVTKAAYGNNINVVKVMRNVNDHPYNKRFRVMVDNEKNWFPQGRISFTKIFGTVAEQAADPANGGRDLPGSNFYATFWFPPATEVV